MRDRNHDEAMAEEFKQDPAYTLELLNEILMDGEQGELLIALRQMAKAFGGVQSVAEKANLNPTQLYRTLSEEGNPELRSLSAILKAMGLRLAVERVRAACVSGGNCLLRFVISQVWISRPGKLQKPELKRTRTHWSRFIVSPVPKSGGPGPPSFWL